ncbi:MAG: DUF2188 domain-containing protein [Selenomonadaceae bacterium]|nr:DUF2188 domain-containing protein [Selenomonadaceae bacterium]
MGKNQWISKHGDQWGVKGEGNSRFTKLFDTQHAAAVYGRTIAQNQHSELIIKGANGRIRSKDSYGNDPCPPRDREH